MGKLVNIEVAPLPITAPVSVMVWLAEILLLSAAVIEVAMSRPANVPAGGGAKLVSHGPDDPVLFGIPAPGKVTLLPPPPPPAETG